MVRTRSHFVVRGGRNVRLASLPYSRGQQRLTQFYARTANMFPGTGGAIVRGAARAAGRAVPVVRAALAARDMYQMVRRIRSSSVSKKRRSGGEGGQYVGRFKRPRKLAKKDDKFLGQGFKHTSEVHGTVSDPDCVYVGHTTFSGHQTLEVVLQALLRKLLSRAGVITKSVTDPIPGYDTPNTSNAWRFVLERVNKEDGVVDRFTYSTAFATNVSIYQIVGNRQMGVSPLWGDLFNVFVDYAIGNVGAASIRTPVRLVLYQQEENITEFWQFRSEVNLQNEMLHIMSKSEIKVQNRTVSASGSGDSDNVSSNPIEGKLYHFKGGAPRAKIEGVHFIESVPDLTGVITARAAQFTTQLVMAEPPEAKMFWNCKKASKIRLNPGDIKNDIIYYRKSMPFLKFLTLMKLGWTATAAQKQINLFGKCAMIAFEDTINVNPDHSLLIAYEVNREFGAYLSTMKPKFAAGFRYSAEQNSP